jgi:hypothetical protein
MGWLCDIANNRRDQKSGNSLIARQATHDFDQATIETNFLLGFTQRRFDRSRIVSLAGPPRKTDLTGMMEQMIGALSEQQRYPKGTFNQTD